MVYTNLFAIFASDLKNLITMEIRFRNEVVGVLGLPDIPKKEWDGETPFKKGVAIVGMYGGGEAYAVCSFDKDSGHTKPHITKVFCVERFTEIKKIFIVPDYMNSVEEVEEMDLDEESKKKAEELLKEASELENEGVEEGIDTLTGENEWVFPEINNLEEAKAWLKRYNQQHKIKGSLPKSEETVKLRLLSIYSELNKGK